MLTCLVLTGGCQRSTIPAALTDQEFWALIERVSEPPGMFDLSDAFVSNEPHFPDLIRRLRPTGNVYIGVGPEQNFSYVARLRPAMAFIIDIRRENLSLHLLYKALFELATDRADFVSRLFSRPRPPGLGVDASVREIFARYERVPPSPEQYEATRRLIRERLLVTHRLPLSRADLEWIERAFRAFYTEGPDIHFWGAHAGDAAGPSFRLLMTAEDVTRHSRSFLAAEEGFAWVKTLQSSNRIVPVIGDFGGPRALRLVSEYIRKHGEVVHAFYGSNVGAYLTREQSRAFCRNLAALPAAPGAWFIESNRMRPLRAKLRACPSL